MSRLEGKQPNASAIIIGAVIFSLVAAGLFFAFRPVPEPTDAGLSNSAPPSESSAPSPASEAEAEATSAAGSENSLTTILTPLPEATPTQAPAPTELTTPESAPTIQPAATPTNIGPPVSRDSIIKPAPTASMR